MAEKRRDSRGRNLEKGEMQRKEDGRYLYRYTDMYGKTKTVYALTLTELRQKEKQIAKDLSEGIVPMEAMKFTVNQYFNMYMDMKDNLRPSTKKNYIGMWKSAVEPSFVGNMKISEVKSIHIQKLYSEWKKDGRAKATIKFLKNMLMQVFQSAYNSDIIRKNPVKGVEYSGSEKKKEALTIRQQELLLDFVENSNVYDIYHPMIVFMLGTAMRVGEVTGLTWSDIDMQNKKISVTHQLKYGKIDGASRLYIADTKTKAGVRNIDMTNAVQKALREQKRMYMAEGRRSECEIDGYSDFIFITKNGAPFSTAEVNFILKHIVQAYNKQETALAGLEDRIPELLPHISSHIMRHTGCTRMAEVGIDPKVLQGIMGHSDISVTMNVYNHNNDCRAQKEMEKAESIIKVS